jgi:hypothetical protein
VDLDRLAQARLPLTLEDAVAARLAVLSPVERRLLEHAAAMGSVFWLGGLVALARMDREPPDFWTEGAEGDVGEIERLLADLVHRDYVLRLPDSAFPGEVEYVFKHNLERERIAQMISPAANRRRHQTIADWLAQKDNVRSQEEYSAMLARHLEHAGCLTRAAFTYIIPAASRVLSTRPSAPTSTTGAGSSYSAKTTLAAAWTRCTTTATCSRCSVAPTKRCRRFGRCWRSLIASA